MSPLTSAQVVATPAGHLAEQPADVLFNLKNSMADLHTAAKAAVDHVDRALELKYADRARRLRLDAGKDTGVVHFDDGRVRITADCPKKIDWDQVRLADITRRIVANGDDPAQYVEITYRVSEAKFTAWPQSLKDAFIPARTLRTGKASFRLALLQE